jgi:DtxR family Mn-dependent transcriptional regulator
MSTSNIQEYLQTLYSLEEEGVLATTTEIAKRLGFAPPSVTEMLKRLAERGHVRYEPYKGVVLTDRGRLIARKVTRKHRILERFLHDILKIRGDNAHKQACEMEHALSDEAENGLCKILQSPDECPDGNPIPICDKNIKDCVACEPAEDGTTSRRIQLLPLCALRPGQKAIVRFIRGGRMAVKRLCDLGVTAGTQIQLKSCAPLAGPVEITVRGSSLAIGHGLAAKIFVEEC